MPPRAAALDPQVEKLRTITNTTQLVRYLHTELDWPVDVEDVDDAFFDWHPDELFLNDEHRVAIHSIKQLRPLSSGQPWGIFFVEFDKKRLPIVVLRRVLNSLAIKRRANTKKGGGHQTWHARDLLFVSSFGEAGHREIALAHFTDESEHGDLPVLRVLGWDEDDTTLQLAHVAKTLHARLQWPQRTDGAEAQKAWREQWAGAFTLQYRQAINDAKSLALALAQLAKRIRIRANSVLKAESERGHLRKLHQAFKDNLIADLTDDGFADMFAQTIAYGLFTAHVSRSSGALVADDVALMVPSTNPFLRDLLQDFLQAAGRGRQRHQRVDFDELGINDVVELLRHAPMADILRSFNNDRPDEDPVIHFYEDFLKAYDKKMRAKRGVFYTPRPVVQFIVRSVHEILQTEFGIEDGLASTITWGEMRKRKPELALPAHTTDDMPFVQILDPATGTATFLVETIDLIHRHLLGKWRGEKLSAEQIAAKWNNYVREHLLPRLHGFELMMAPYAIAHMKIGLKLGETGYIFPEDGPRVNVFLTNTLEPAHEIQPQLEALAPMLAHEARAANKLKDELYATVIVGNPPYSKSLCDPAWFSQSIGDWKRGLKLGKKDLTREEWKFMRLAQLRSRHVGVVGFVINRDFLDGMAKQVMRHDLEASHGFVRVLDLNGDVKGRLADENVFEIEQGVTVAILAAGSATKGIRYFSLEGTRILKLDWLLRNTSSSAELHSITPSPPYYLWTAAEHDESDPYVSWWPTSVLFSMYSSGIQTKADSIVVDYSPDTLLNRLKNVSTLDPEDVKSTYTLDAEGNWDVRAAQRDLRETGCGKSSLTPFLYRPFDVRFTYWTGKTNGVHARPRRELMQHVVRLENIGLLFNRQVVQDSVTHFFVSRWPTNHGTFYLGNKGQDYFAPLWLYAEPARGGLGADSVSPPSRSTNFNADFIEALCEVMGLSSADWSPGDDGAPLYAERVFNYLYSVVHSPEYRKRYANFLRLDFPRIPVPGSRKLFDALTILGGELVKWHLLEEPSAVAITATTVPKGVNVPAFFGNDRKLLKVAEKSRELADLEAISAGPSGKVYINATSGFSGVRQAVWQHSIGGYQVLHKWLDDRRKAERSLSDDDIAHWRRVYAALEATQSLMVDVDKVITEHGGWPGAFSQDYPPPDPATLAAQPVAKRPRANRASAGQTSLFGDADGEGNPRPKAKATPARAKRSAGGATKAELDDVATMVAMRDVLRVAAEPLAREVLIRRTAHALGFQRTGPNIAAALDDAVRRAVRRGIAVRDKGKFSLLTRNISDFERDFLKTQFLACLGREWVARKDLAPRLARWLGFARTGPVIEATVKSLVNSLLRSGDLQKRRDEVHRA